MTRRRTGERDVRVLEAPADAPGFDLPRRVSVLEAHDQAQAEELEALRRGFVALLRVVEQHAARLDARTLPEPVTEAEPGAAERLPLEDAARRLGRAPATLRRWAAAGRLPGARVEPLDRGGRRWTIPAAVVDRIVRDRERSLRRAQAGRVG